MYRTNVTLVRGPGADRLHHKRSSYCRIRAVLSATWIKILLILPHTFQFRSYSRLTWQVLCCEQANEKQGGVLMVWTLSNADRMASTPEVLNACLNLVTSARGWIFSCMSY